MTLRHTTSWPMFVELGVPLFVSSHYLAFSEVTCCFSFECYLKLIVYFVGHCDWACAQTVDCTNYSEL